MKKIYILSKRDRNQFLKNEYRFNGHRVDIDKKGVITSLSEFLSNFNENLIIVSEGVRAYFTFFASNYADKSVSILINPVFFINNGTLVLPSHEYLNDIRNNKIVLLSEDNPRTKNTSKLLNDLGIRYRILKGKDVTNDQLAKVLSVLKIKSVSELKKEIDKKSNKIGDHLLKEKDKSNLSDKYGKYGKYYK
jgi:hypothetical protein